MSAPEHQPWHAAYPSPTSIAVFLSQATVLGWMESGEKIAGRDFVLVDLRRSDHEVSCIYFSSAARLGPRFSPLVHFSYMLGFDCRTGPHSSVSVGPAFSFLHSSTLLRQIVPEDLLPHHGPAFFLDFHSHLANMKGRNNQELHQPPSTKYVPFYPDTIQPL